MSLKSKLLLPSLIVILLGSYLYFSYKTTGIEQKYNQNLLHLSHNLRDLYQKLGEIKPKDLLTYLEEIKKDASLASLIAIADNNFIIKSTTKNQDKPLPEELDFQIIGDLAKGEFKPDQQKLYTRYYSNHEEKKSKFNIYVAPTTNNEIICIAYPYKMNRKEITKIALEILVLITILVILATLIYIKISRQEKPKIIKKKKEIVNLDINQKTVAENDNLVSQETSNIATESLNNYVLTLFKTITNNFSPKTISLYLRNYNDKLTKSYELKGQSFIKIQADNFDCLDITKESYQTSLTDDDSQIGLPIIFNKALVGRLVLLKNSPFTTDEIKEIKNELEIIAKQINNYLTIDDLLLDKDTGLYSKIHFELKYNEQVRLAENTDHDFSLIFIKMTEPKTSLEKKEINTIIKLISATITEHLKGDDYLCLYDNYLAIILPRVKGDEALAISNSLRITLTKYRIKINPEKILPITPSFGIASTTTTVNKSQILTTALNNLKLDLDQLAKTN